MSLDDTLNLDGRLNLSSVLNLSRIHFPITTLGPGQRIGIWLQGCSIRCPGCISVDTWSHAGNRVEIAEVISSISEWLPLADGITISGGEPFEQPAVLKTLLAKLRPLSTGDILVYSGFPLEQIQYHLDEMNGLIDALITEPFLKDEMQTLPLRGSDNQKLVILTRLGKERYSDIDTTQSQSVKRLDIMFDDDSNTVWIAGIPQRGDLEKLSLLLNSQGLLNRTSEEDSGGSTPCHKN